MTWWARVLDGIVQEAAIDLPTGDQPSKYFPNSLPGTWEQCADGTPQSGWSFSAPSTFTAPSVYSPTLAQQAAAAIIAGLELTSSSDSSLNGTYAIDPISQSKIIATQLYIQVTGTFYGGATTYPWLDAANNVHTFPSVAEFTKFATAVADYVAALDIIMASNEGSLPSQPVNIE